MCNTRHAVEPQLVDNLQASIDYIRLGPIDSELEFFKLESAFSQLALNRVNYYGHWFVDLTGDTLELLRTFMTMQDAIDILQAYRWTRLDVAFDVTGLNLDKIPHPGTVIQNDDRTETVYSHHLKQRGQPEIFLRCYDAFAAGHAVEPGTVRIEVEFKKTMPDVIRQSRDIISNALQCAAHHIHETFLVTIKDTPTREMAPRKRKLEHDRERFYRRYGKAIARDLADLGEQRMLAWILDCLNKGEKNARVQLPAKEPQTSDHRASDKL